MRVQFVFIRVGVVGEELRPCRAAAQANDEVTLRQAEGALSLVLGAAERRGFRPLAVDGEAQADGDRWYLRLTVEGERDDANLQNQLSKLYDCLEVEVSPCQ